MLVRPAHLSLILIPLALGSLAACRPASVRAEQEAALADQLVALKAYPAAAATLGKAISLDPDNDDLWLRLARAQLQAGNTIGADQAYQRAAELAPDNVEALENLVVLAVRAGQLDRAKRYMDPLLVLQPDDPAGLLAQGAIALEEHRTSDARAAAERLVASDPDVAEGHILRARVLMADGDVAAAATLLRGRTAALKDGPDAIEARDLLVACYRRLGDLAGVRTTALELFRLQPGNPAYALEAARAFHAAGRDVEADRALAGLLRAHPGSIAIVQAVIDFRRGTMPPAAAIRTVRALAQGAPQPIAVVVANNLSDMGAPGEALALAEPLAGGTVTGDNEDAAVAVARALAAGGHGNAARAKLDAVLDYDPGHVGALVARGELRLAAGDGSGALADAQLAWSDDATSAPAALLVARVHAVRGEPALAQQSYALAVQAFPDDYRVLGTYLDWLAASGHAGEGLQPLASYVRRHRRDGVAAHRFATLCRATGDACAAETGAAGV